MNTETAVGIRRAFMTLAGLGIMPAAQADLTLVPGMTRVQAPVAATIQSICPPLNSPSVYPGLNPEQQLLAQSCTKMVQTSNAQQGAGGTRFDLGLTEGQLRDALQGISPEEMNAQNRGRTVTTTAPINARLLALRRGAGGPGALASSFDFNGEKIVLSDTHPEGSRGGGASADGLGGPWSGYVNGYYNWGRRDASELENAFDFDDYGFIMGGDYRVRDNTVVGLALSYGKSDADFKEDYGDVESSNLGLSLYASHSKDNFYVDGFLGFTRVDYDTARRIFVQSTTAVEGFDSTAVGSTDGNQFSAAIGAGYDWVNKDLTVTPSARLGYINLDVDGFTERESKHGLGLDVNDRSVISLQSAIGVQVSKAISLESGVVNPYAGIEWNHEFRNDAGQIIAKYTHDPFNSFFAIPTASPDRNFFTLRAGLTSYYPSGVSAFANLDYVAGLKDTRASSLTVGVRVEF